MHKTVKYIFVVSAWILALCNPPAQAFTSGGGLLGAPARFQAIRLSRQCSRPGPCMVGKHPKAMVSPHAALTKCGLAALDTSRRLGSAVANVGEKAAQALLRAALSFVLILGTLGLLRPATVAAMDGSVCGSQDRAAQLRRSDPDVDMPAAITRQGFRLAFAGPAQQESASNIAGDTKMAADRPAFVTHGREWKGFIGEMKLSKKFAKAFKYFNDWLLFQVYGVLASDGVLKLLVFSGFSATLVGIGAWLLRMADGEDSAGWGENLYRAYTLLNNVAGADAVSEENKATSVVVNVLFITGLMTFAILLGLVTSAFENGLENAIEGTHRVVAKEHVVMLGWGEKSPAMLRQINAALKDKRLPSGTPLVILANVDKEVLDEDVDEAFGGHRQHLTVHTREGNPAVFSDLELVSAGDAKHVLLVAPDGKASVRTGSSERVLVQTTAVQALEASCQPSKKVGVGRNDIKMVVAGFESNELEEGALPGVTVMPRGDFSRRLLAAATSQSGLGLVYQELFDQSEGCEIYMRSTDKYPWLNGKTFRELSAHFADAVVLGWTSGGELACNPPQETKLPPGSDIIVLARSDNFRCTKEPKKMTTAAGESWKPANKKLSSAAARDAARVILLDDAETCDNMLVKDMASLLSAGSEITTVGNKKPVAAHVPRVATKHVTGSALNLAAVAEAKPETADIVVVRSIGVHDASGQERDGRVLAKTRLVLLARQQHADPKPLRLVAEVNSEETIEKLQNLVKRMGGKSVKLETLDSNRLASGAIIQVLWTPELKGVYLDLMDSDGSEISLVSASFFGSPGQTRSFGDITELAMNNNAVPLGVLKADGELILRSEVFVERFAHVYSASRGVSFCPCLPCAC